MYPVIFVADPLEDDVLPVELDPLDELGVDGVVGVVGVLGVVGVVGVVGVNGIFPPDGPHGPKLRPPPYVGHLVQLEDGQYSDTSICITAVIRELAETARDSRVTRKSLAALAEEACPPIIPKRHITSKAHTTMIADTPTPTKMGTTSFGDPATAGTACGIIGESYTGACGCAVGAVLRCTVLCCTGGYCVG